MLAKRFFYVCAGLFLLAILPRAVWSQNRAPVVDAGPDTLWYMGCTYIVLDGSAVDPDGDSILLYEWAVESTPV